MSDAQLSELLQPSDRDLIEKLQAVAERFGAPWSELRLFLFLFAGTVLDADGLRRFWKELFLPKLRANREIESMLMPQLVAIVQAYVRSKAPPDESLS